MGTRLLFSLVVLLWPCLAGALTPEHEKCLDRLVCEYGAWNIGAEKSYEGCVRQVEFQRKNNKPLPSQFQDCRYKLLSLGVPRGEIRGTTPQSCEAKLNEKTSSSVSRTPALKSPARRTPNSVPERRLTDKEKRESLERFRASLMPSAEEAQRDIRLREAKWLERERAEAERKAREQNAWKNRPAAERARLTAELGEIQDCLFQFRRESFDPPESEFSSAVECRAALDAARAGRIKHGEGELTGKISACVAELEKMGYPVPSGAGKSYPACEKELENARLLVAQLAADEAAAKITEDNALEECLKTFDDEKLSLSTDDITTPEGCSRRLEQAREMREKKKDNDETNRLVGLIGKEDDISKQLPLIERIPIESYRNDELSRWNSEKNAVDNCLIRFYNFGIMPPDEAKLNSSKCTQAFEKLQKERASAEREAQRKKDAEEFQEAVENNLERSRIEKGMQAGQAKAAGSANDKKAGSGKSKEVQSELRGKVYPAKEHRVNIGDFTIFNEDMTVSSAFKRLDFIKGIGATLQKEKLYYDAVLTWEDVPDSALMELSDQLAIDDRKKPPHIIFMYVYSCKDRPGNTGKRELVLTSSGKIESRRSMAASISPEDLPYKTNYIWIKVKVRIVRIEAEEWIYAGRIDQ